MYSLARKTDGQVKAFIYAVFVHIALLGLLLIGFQWQKVDRAFTGNKAKDKAIVKAVVINSAQMDQQVRQLKQEMAQKRAAELAQQRQQAEQQRQAQAEAARLALKQQQLQQAKAAAERARLQLAQKAAAQQALEKKQAALLTKQAQAKALLQKQAQKDAELALQEQLDSEQKQRQAAHQKQQQATADARAQSEVERYKGFIGQKVRQNWINPLGATKGLKCVLEIRVVVPGGEVLGVRIINSSGNDVFDRSVQNAVYKASPLPVPNDSALFDDFRDLKFVFNPDGKLLP